MHERGGELMKPTIACSFEEQCFGLAGAAEIKGVEFVCRLAESVTEPPKTMTPTRSLRLVEIRGHKVVAVTAVEVLVVGAVVVVPVAGVHRIHVAGSEVSVVVDLRFLSGSMRMAGWSLRTFAMLLNRYSEPQFGASTDASDWILFGGLAAKALAGVAFVAGHLRWGVLGTVWIGAYAIQIFWMYLRLVRLRLAGVSSDDLSAGQLVLGGWLGPGAGAWISWGLSAEESALGGRQGWHRWVAAVVRFAWTVLFLVETFSLIPAADREYIRGQFLLVLGIEVAVLVAIRWTLAPLPERVAESEMDWNLEAISRTGKWIRIMALTAWLGFAAVGAGYVLFWPLAVLGALWLEVLVVVWLFHVLAQAACLRREPLRAAVRRTVFHLLPGVHLFAIPVTFVRLATEFGANVRRWTTSSAVLNVFLSVWLVCTLVSLDGFALPRLPWLGILASGAAICCTLFLAMGHVEQRVRLHTAEVRSDVPSSA